MARGKVWDENTVGTQVWTVQAHLYMDFFNEDTGKYSRDVQKLETKHSSL